MRVSVKLAWNALSLKFNAWHLAGLSIPQQPQYMYRTFTSVDIVSLHYYTAEAYEWLLQLGHYNELDSLPPLSIVKSINFYIYSWLYAYLVEVGSRLLHRLWRPCRDGRGPKEECRLRARQRPPRRPNPGATRCTWCGGWTDRSCRWPASAGTQPEKRLSSTVIRGHARGHVNAVGYELIHTFTAILCNLPA